MNPCLPGLFDPRRAAEPTPGHSRSQAARTIVLVTPQLEEALLLGRRIIVMHPDSTICEFDLTDLPYPRDLDDPTLRRLKKAITDQCRYTA